MAMQNKTLLYYDSIDHKCFSEFDYFHKCATPSYEIDMPQTQGALHIINCHNKPECWYADADLKALSALTLL